jgi:hypothetical protein
MRQRMLDKPAAGPHRDTHMETRANHLWVGAVTLVLLAALAAFIVWIARLGQGAQDEYDIFYSQSVDGLANGSRSALPACRWGR